MGFYPASATVEIVGGNPCMMRASASMGLLNVRRSQLCIGPVGQSIWNIPVSPCNLGGIGASGTKICRYPGDTVKGTYLTGNGPTTSVCDRVMNDSEGNFLYRIRIVVQDPGVITVS